MARQAFRAGAHLLTPLPRPLQQAARYWEVEEQEQRRALEECPTCGEKGHDKRSCPHLQVSDSRPGMSSMNALSLTLIVLQCLACGALDKHSTRECPMGLNCFRCGGRGHKALECKMPRTQGAQGWRECRRCGATSHVESNCPTLWRIYSYRSSEENLAERRKKFVAGEADRRGAAPPARFDYRSESESDQDDKRARSPANPPRDWDPAERWCYNCAAGGNHWGDDCPLPRCNPTRTGGDPSPYSEYLASSGPHARHLPPPPPPDPYAYREGLRSRDGFDRFEAGPGASMHVYDPQREAMKSVDQLFDRHGPGASRQRDAARRRGERDVEPLRPKPVDRRSGEGSKAERYREAERERGSERERRRRGEDRPIQVSANGPPAPLLAPNNATLTNGRGSEDDVVFVSAKETDGRMTKAQAKQERRREKMAKKREKRQRKKADLRDRLEKEEEFRRAKKARTGQAVIEVDDSDYEDSGGSDSDDDSSDQGKAASAQKAKKHHLKGSEEQELPAERRQLRSMDGARTKLERASGEAEAREKDKSEARQFMKQWTPASMAAEAKEQDKVKRKREGPLVEAGIADSVKVDRPTSTKKAKTDRNRALMKEQHEASQARRLAGGKVEEHAEREKVWLEMEASWMAKDAREEKKASKAAKAAETKAKAKSKKRAAQVAPPRQPRLSAQNQTMRG